MGKPSKVEEQLISIDNDHAMILNYLCEDGIVNI
jgi:hypothetical protein